MSLAFKVDENLPIEAAALLRQAGYDAATVEEQGLTGGPDTDLAEACKREGRVLVTLDLDFADLLTYPPDQAPGFVVLRGRRQDKATVLDLIRGAIRLLGSEPLEHHLWIVEDDRVRIRP